MKYEPIEGERQCKRCEKCKPLSEFSPGNYRCKKCRRDDARNRKLRNPCKSRLRAARPWSPEEEDILMEHYPPGGVAACTPLLDRTAGQIKSKIEKMGLCRDVPMRKHVEPEWGVPAHDYTAPDIAFRRWPASWRQVGILSPHVGLVMGVQS